MTANPWFQLTLGIAEFQPTPTPETHRVAEALRRLAVLGRLEEPMFDCRDVRIGWGDIYVPVHLFIEVDGHQHRSDTAQVWLDSYRAAICAERGIHIIRVPNWDAARLSYYALAMKLRSALMPYVRMRGLAWADVLMNGSLPSEPANDNQ